VTSPSRIVRFASVDSTQSLVFSLAEAGAADGTAVVADYQRLGRGRQRRTWDAASSTSLLVSILVRTTLAAPERPLLGFATAVAVGETLARLVPLAPRLKWPNDVLAGGKKLAGILLESRQGTAERAVVAIGIGLNLRQREFPSDLQHRATSVLLETGVELERDQVLEALLATFDGWRLRLERDGFAPVRERWLALTETIGRRVSADGVEGTAVDLATDGALIVEEGVTRHRIVAGEVSWPGATGGGIGAATTGPAAATARPDVLMGGGDHAPRG
jgi:BirA family transcriptional regulator, biotin operon repressor / biotin---[acetyl-CoA-carboxylase] ligase